MLVLSFIILNVSVMLNKTDQYVRKGSMSICTRLLIRPVAKRIINKFARTLFLFLTRIFFHSSQHSRFELPIEIDLDYLY